MTMEMLYLDALNNVITGMLYPTSSDIAESNAWVNKRRLARERSLTDDQPPSYLGTIRMDNVDSIMHVAIIVR
jgi:hypothetical protein